MRGINAYEILVGKPDRERPLERLRRGQDAIKVVSQQQGVYWIRVAPGRVQ
jgi:hypothetical protein